MKRKEEEDNEEEEEDDEEEERRRKPFISLDQAAFKRLAFLSILCVGSAI
jgi:hypothetical protein